MVAKLFYSKHVCYKIDVLPSGVMWRHSGLMVSVLDSGFSGSGLRPGRDQYVVFLLSQRLSPPRCLNVYCRI